MKLKKLDYMLKELLAINALPVNDPSLNGLQVDRTEQEIRSVAFAVDASLESFRRTAEVGADMLFVHHGILWGAPLRIRGNFYNRIKYLMEKDIALYAVHLPLDLHPELGNNIAIAEALGLEEISPFGNYKGVKIGYKGILPEEKTTEQILGIINGNQSKALGILPFGPEKNRKIGIVSGGDTNSALQAIDEGLDLFITGDASHEIYHPCQEGGLNVIFGGHYATETWGIRRVALKLKELTDLEIHILDIPTGL